MRLIAPTGIKEMAERVLWFKKPLARRLAKEKKVEFGLELKGPLDGLKETPSVFWGVHLPDYVTTEWYYHPERRKKIFSFVSNIASLKPNYVVVHGIHLWWQPPAAKYIHRYFNTSDAKEYLKMMAANIEFINEIKNIVPVKFENCELCLCYQDKKGNYLPETFLDPGIGRLDDLLYLKEKTGVDLLIDIEHLVITLNLLKRRKNYSKLPFERIKKPTAEDKKIKKIFGFWLKKHFIPYSDAKLKMVDLIKKYPAKYYHLCGNFQDVIPGKKIVSHGPIEPDSKTFRKILRAILATKPEVLVLETANSTLNKAWNYLRPNETEISFDNLCGILLEEM